MTRRGTKLAGARVLITGGTKGIGRLMAADAVARGAEVELWARDESVGAQVVAPLGRRARFVRVDVTDPDEIAAAAADAGPMDVVVNNAGVVSGKDFIDLTEAELRRTFEVNALAPFNVTRAFLPSMLERDRGTIVNLASAAGLIGTAKMTDYSASKHAVVGFTESLRAELRARRSKVGTLIVCPFYIDTGMFDGAHSSVPWLLPMLKEADVARRVLDAIETGRERLLLPPALYTLPLVRLLPLRAADAVLDLLGVQSTMDDFTGRG